jgi:hypothetical protein
MERLREIHDLDLPSGEGFDERGDGIVGHCFSLSRLQASGIRFQVVAEKPGSFAETAQQARPPSGSFVFETTLLLHPCLADT